MVTAIAEAKKTEPRRFAPFASGDARAMSYATNFPELRNGFRERLETELQQRALEQAVRDRQHATMWFMRNELRKLMRKEEKNRKILEEHKDRNKTLHKVLAWGMVLFPVAFELSKSIPQVERFYDDMLNKVGFNTFLTGVVAGGAVAYHVIKPVAKAVVSGFLAVREQTKVDELQAKIKKLKRETKRAKRDARKACKRAKHQHLMPVMIGPS